MQINVCHLTSAHPRYDTRIFVKECRSLAKTYTVNLVVADGDGDETRDGIHFHDVGKPKGRLDRMLTIVKRVYSKAVALESDIYHLHDPELLPVGLKLKKQGKRVIFDAHEDIPLQIFNKTYLHPLSRHILSAVFARFEAYACRRFDGIITATPHIREKFLAINPNALDINNYPVLEELGNAVSYAEKGNRVCYVGYITEARGIKELVRAMERTGNCTLAVAGKFQQRDVEEEVRKYPGWGKVDFLGFLDREGIKALLSDARAGVVTLHPTPNYLDALPVKMFEYMAAGIAVIASDFPLWRSIVDDAACGLCVDPKDPESIADAINYLITHPGEAEQMGANGKRAAQEKYNWNAEEHKLLGFYAGILRDKERGQ